jgi:hypothetical protein
MNVSALLNPMAAVAKALGELTGKVAGEKLTELRDAIVFAQANNEMARQMLDRVQRGEVTDQAAVDQIVKRAGELAQESRDRLRKAVAGITVDFPKEVVQRVDDSLTSVIKAAATGVAVFEGLSIGSGLVAAAALYALTQGRSKGSDNVMLIGAALFVLSGGKLLGDIQRMFGSKPADAQASARRAAPVKRAVRLVSVTPNKAKR